MDWSSLYCYENVILKFILLQCNLHLNSMEHPGTDWHDWDVQGYAAVEHIDPDMFFKQPPSHSTRGHRYKQSKPHAENMIRHYYVNIHAIDAWNRLPNPMFDVKSIKEFKASLDVHWMREQYTLPMWNDCNVHELVKCQHVELQA